MNRLFLFSAHFPVLGVGKLFLKGWIGNILGSEHGIWLQLPYSAILGQKQQRGHWKEGCGYVPNEMAPTDAGFS